MIRRCLGLFAVLMVSLGVSVSSSGAAVPDDPIDYTKGTPKLVGAPDPDLSYWVYVPQSYDETHQTPTRLLIWLHGCGGDSAGDIWNVSPGGDQSWISIAPTGREGECWDPLADPSKVLYALVDVAKHFNIDRRRVMLGGYSSGGDLAYRTAFDHAGLFAGILVENTTPFRDSGLPQSMSLASASWKFNVLHLAHKQDLTYPIGVVRNETKAMTDAGFPLELIERTGTHYDDPGAIVAGESVPGTVDDLRTYLLPQIDGDWVAPEPKPGPGHGPGPGPGPGTNPDPVDPARPEVKIKTAPGRKTRSRKAAFRFKSSIPGSAFKCRVDHQKFRDCRSPKRYRGLRAGRHTFRVRAVTDTGVAGPVTKYSWKVAGRR